MEIRKIVTAIEDIYGEAGRAADPPLRKVAVIAGGRAHGGEDVGPLVADLTRPRRALGPAPPTVTDPALIADARFILKPELQDNFMAYMAVQAPLLNAQSR